MDIQILQNFLKVARTLHFTKASEDASIAQPALSRQIQQLEDTLGAQLFKRNKRKVELTEAGLFFKTEVERILQQWNDACTRTEQIHKGVAGEIRIGYTHSAMQAFLPDMIRQINQVFPNMRTRMFELTNLQQVKALENKELEIGFTTNPVIEGSIKSKVLLHDNFVVVVPIGHPVSQENYNDFSVFAEEGFILPPKDESSLYVATIESICLDAGFIPKIVHETSFASTGIRLVEAGIGITIEPKSGLRGQPHGVKYIELKNIPQKADLTMLWHKDLEKQKPQLLNLLLKA
ncbi:LysR substrate-binding domain-containing protein [Chryseolinea sp. H1M3-3]|uniref:LysR substrate-binding domain-containing protein n=1 Tax=Chryseolinea sp. H1M3-3 TaxID=3034144 RepID=UPI0023ECF533|nr:LysR substrate-binding domain-containing protein [Chryseolinea sp. H1M3-3]